MLFPQVMRRPHLAGDALISAQRDQARRNWPTRESDAPRQRSAAQSVVEIAISSRGDASGRKAFDCLVTFGGIFFRRMH